MTLTDVLMIFIIAAAIVGTIAVVKRWYRACEEEFSYLIEPRHESMEPPARLSPPQVKSRIPQH
jgi:hypothetical protein